MDQRGSDHRGSFQPASAARRRRNRFARTFALGLLILSVSPSIVSARQLENNREHAIKAAYLYNFTRYVQWPDTAFAGATSPILIGFLKPDPVGELLRLAVRGKKVDGRTIEVKTFEKPEQVTTCHVFFVSQAMNAETRQVVMERLASKNVLFVGETDEFLGQGGAINLVIVNNNVRFDVDLAAAQREALTISSKLLRVARHVAGQEQRAGTALQPVTPE